MNNLFTLWFLFNTFILSHLLHYRPCQAAFGVTPHDSKKKSVHVRSLNQNRALPLYAMPPVLEDLTAMITVNRDFLENLLIEIVKGAIPMSILLAFVSLLAKGVKREFKVEIVEKVSKLNENITELKADIKVLDAKIDTTKSELKSDIMVIDAKIDTIKSAQDNQNEKLQIWADKQKMELDKMKLVMMEHKNKSQEEEK